MKMMRTPCIAVSRARGGAGRLRSMQDVAPGPHAPILVPVDFSAHSRAALLWAADAARRYDAALVILHVAHDPADEPGSYARRDETTRAPGSRSKLRRIEDMARDHFDAYLAEVRKENPTLAALQSARARLVVGLPATRIVEVAQEEGAGMIVMGSHGRKGLSHAMIGSQAARVARLAQMPVVVVKDTAAD